MKSMKWIMLLLDLRKMWKSKTFSLARVLTFVPAIDLAFFEGDVGSWIAVQFMNAVNLLPFIEISLNQAVSFLIVVLGGLVAWLRAVTVEPLENKQ